MRMQAVTLDTVFQNSPVASRIHPCILQLGLQYADGSIAGGNARCLAMLQAFKTVIEVSLLFVPFTAFITLVHVTSRASSPGCFSHL